MTERFHDGERAAQARVGVRERMGQIGAFVIRDAMPEQHREFFRLLPFVLVGGADAAGQPWASAIAGPTGFVDSPTPQRLTIDATRDPNDPVLGNARPDMPIGVLGLEPHTRRRNRANGVVAAIDPEAMVIDVRESFGNCPKYIQARRATYHASRIRPPSLRRTVGLDDDARAVVRSADTFFIASAHPDIGIDVSHRGGKPGFIHVDGDTLTVPDYSGNFFFNTLGNLMVDPRAGLLFLDFERGDLWHLATDVEILWDGPELEAYAGAVRLLRLRVREVLHRPGALPLRWGEAEPSPFLP